jgi:hypothetical protein
LWFYLFLLYIQVGNKVLVSLPYRRDAIEFFF